MTPTVLTRLVARLLLAPAYVVAAGLLVRGYADVGDGFAAGVVVALAILLQYAAFGRETTERELPIRYAPTVALAGLGLAIAVAFAPWLAGRAPLEHWPDPGAEVTKIGTLELITAVAFDVGIFLLVVGAVTAFVHLTTTASDQAGEEGTA